MPKSTVDSWDALPLLLSIRQVMDVLGVSKSVAYALAHQDRFPAVWVNNRTIRVPRDSLRRWVEEQAGSNGKTSAQ